MQNTFFLKNKEYIFPALFIFVCLLAVVTLFLPHMEHDEVVYEFLAVKLAHLQPYNLQGSYLLQHLPKGIYNTPVFFRPPAFMVYLAILYRILGTIGMHLSSVFVFAALLIVMYRIVFILTKSQNSALKSLVLTALSSLLLFSSLLVHVDMFMTLLITLSFYYLLISRETHKGRDIFLSGLFLSLAVLTKYTAILCYPFYLALLLANSQKKFLLKDIFLFLFPLLIVAAWLYNILILNHMSIASLSSSPNKEEIARFPFVSYVYHRPLNFYFVNIFLVNPNYLFVFLLLKKNIWRQLRSRYGKMLYFLLGIILFSLVSITFYGISGGTYQMRDTLIFEPFFIILISLIPFEEFAILWKLFWAFALYNLLIVFFNTSWQTAELFSFFELALLNLH